MGSLQGLASRMNQWADDVGDVGSEAAIDVALVIVGSLAFDTPVDTSKAISSWQVALDTPVPTRRQAFFPGVKGSTYRASAQATLAAAKAELLTKKPGQPIYISNLEPYIRRLNAGSSSQSAGAFIELAVKRGRDNLHKKHRGK